MDAESQRNATSGVLGGEALFGAGEYVIPQRTLNRSTHLTDFHGEESVIEGFRQEALFEQTHDASVVLVGAVVAHLRGDGTEIFATLDTFVRLPRQGFGGFLRARHTFGALRSSVTEKNVRQPALLWRDTGARGLVQNEFIRPDMKLSLGGWNVGVMLGVLVILLAFLVLRLIALALFAVLPLLAWLDLDALRFFGVFFFAAAPPTEKESGEKQDRKSSRHRSTLPN